MSVQPKLHGNEAHPPLQATNFDAMTKPPRPNRAIVYYRGIPHELDLARCRRALVWRQVEGDMDSMESLAAAVGISRSTASRFFGGRPTSLAVTLRILGALRLRFEDVAMPLPEERAS